MDNKLDLNLLRLFVAAVQYRTLSEAARRSGMTRSNASRQLKALEQAVGAQLLRRTTRHTEVTEAGQVLYAHGLRMLEEMDMARASIDSLGKSVRGDVRIRLPTGLGHLYLTKVLLQFAKEYPDVSLRVLINDFIDDVVHAEVDLALKITSTPPDDHVARRICGIDWSLCASPALIAKAGVVESPEQLMKCPMIAPASLGRRFDLKLEKDGLQWVTRASPRLQSGDYPYLLEAALAGLGIALLPRYAIWQQLKTGDLQEVMPQFKPEGVGDSLYLLTAPNRFMTMASRTLISYITDQISLHETRWRRS